jgi:periplasmic protein CpxP/Spy
MIRHSVLVAALLGSVALSLPAFAQVTQPSTGSTPSTIAPPAAKKPAQQTAKQEAAGVEAHIAQLQKKLKITEQQKPQWDAFAQVMRDNATQFAVVTKSRQEKMKSLNAVDDLRSYQEIAQTHATGLKRLTDTFQTLYDTMSPEQKKNADTVFHDQRQVAAKPAKSGA